MFLPKQSILRRSLKFRYFNFYDRNGLLPADKILRHFSISVIYLQKNLHKYNFFTRNVHLLLLSAFAFVRASIQPILCKTLDQCCPIPLEVAPSESFSNKLVLKSAFCLKLTTKSLSGSSQNFLESNKVRSVSIWGFYL